MVKFGKKELLSEQINEKMNIFVELGVVAEFIEDAQLPNKVKTNIYSLLADAQMEHEEEMNELEYELEKLV